MRLLPNTSMKSRYDKGLKTDHNINIEKYNFITIHTPQNKHVHGTPEKNNECNFLHGAAPDFRDPSVCPTPPITTSNLNTSVF